MRLQLLVLPLSLALSGTALQSQDSEAEPDPSLRTTCTTLADCIAKLRDPKARINYSDSDVDDRMATMGAQAVDALVPMLADPDKRVRENAGYVLTRFRQIDPKHAPAIISAWRKSNGWLPRVMAATRTDEAVQWLWRSYLNNPVQSSNSQVFFAFADLGAERMKPLILSRFAGCRASVDGADCRGLYDILRELDPKYPDWSLDAIADLAINAASEDIRYGANSTLAALQHPAGLLPTQRRLDKVLSEVDPDDGRLWEASRLISAIAGYGPQARSSGATIAQFLDAKYDEDLRVDAVLALGRIDAQTAVGVLIDLEPELTDDWALAYNVAESLGRLRSPQGKPLLERLAAGHWHTGVRNNAARGLAHLSNEKGSTGFADGIAKYRASSEFLYVGDLRWAGDDAGQSCVGRDDYKTLNQNPVARIRWPRSRAIDLEPEELSETLNRQVRKTVSYEDMRGRVVAIHSTRTADFVAFYGGEFGGGVVALSGSKRPKGLVYEPVRFMWQMDGKLYVAAGLAHLFLDQGHVYVIDPKRQRVERIIRLPASPRGLVATPDKVAIVETMEGDLAIREDGTLIDPATLPSCTAD